MSDLSLTSDAVQRIVAEVLRQIRSQQPAGAAALPAPVAPVASAKPAAPVASSGTSLPDKVIPLATLERLPAGTLRVVIGPTAVVTPSAREYARDTGIEITRGAAPAAAAPAARPFFVAQAESGRESAARAAAVVRAVPQAQQVAAAGLADVTATLATHLARDGGRAILLAGRPFLAAALANRSPGVRAVTGRDAAGLLAAVAECAANLVVVDPRQFSAGSLERLGVEFARRDAGPPPAELAPPPPRPETPCSCKGHAHP